MQVRIYKPAKNAMQSGRRQSLRWVMEFEPQAPKLIDPLMGWVGGTDTSSQVRLFFDSKEKAMAYAGRHGHHGAVEETHERLVRPKSYADNFGVHRLTRS